MTGRVYLDGSVLIGALDGVVRDRIRMALRGHVAVSVMIERQKASLGFETTLQVRNKLLSAYRDIMNMPV